MKHQETPPAPQPRLQPSKPLERRQAKKSSFLSRALLIAGFIGLVGGGLGYFYGSTPEDHVSEKEKATILADFSQTKVFHLSAVSSDEQDAALDSMKLDPAAKTLLKSALTTAPAQTQAQYVLSNGTTVISSAHGTFAANKMANPSPVAAAQPQSVRLAWLVLDDYAAEDGDVVEISSEGYRVEVPLLHAPTRIAVPVGPSGSVTVRGVHDGDGGGITAAITSSERPVPLPPMREGQVLTISVN